MAECLEKHAKSKERPKTNREIRFRNGKSGNMSGRGSVFSHVVFTVLFHDQYWRTANVDKVVSQAAVKLYEAGVKSLIDFFRNDRKGSDRRIVELVSPIS